MKRNSEKQFFALAITGAMWFLLVAEASHATDQPIVLDQPTVLVDSSEASYVQYGAQDLAAFLAQISGSPVAVSSNPKSAHNIHSQIVIGDVMAKAVHVDVGSLSDLGSEGALIRTIRGPKVNSVVIAGADPHGTNLGIATLMRSIRFRDKKLLLDQSLDVRSKPDTVVRAFHVNGWSLNYPYSFRAWKEQDWKRFIDIAWAQRVNLVFFWPFMEIMPLPLSAEDEAYLKEVHRVIDYAQKQRGIEVWIMQSANRIALNNCGVADPRLRPYWINKCQKDMNPADPEQFKRLEKVFEAFYKNIDNADAFCMIDSDPGGWPQSTLADQAKIFNAARTLLDQYSQKRTKTKLVDWMWIGWGRHKNFTSAERLVTEFDWTEKNPDEGDLEFMAETMRNFQRNLAEPWEMIAGMFPYLKSSRRASFLNKTIYLPYGAIELEPSYPLTTTDLTPVREALDQAAKYPELKGVMGNNQVLLLQFPRTYYFFTSLWDAGYKARNAKDVSRDVATLIYPDEEEVLADALEGLTEKNVPKIESQIAALDRLLAETSSPRLGMLGRYLFPDALIVVKDLRAQLEIRAARQRLLTALRGTPALTECSQLMEDYFDKLLAWNQQTGWYKIVNIGIWVLPLYENDREFTHAMNRLKQVIGSETPYTSYRQVDDFFEPIKAHLKARYGENSVMIGCIEPAKLTVLQQQ